MSNEATTQWVWMMDWCKQKGLPPASTDVWARAAEAYTRHAIVRAAAEIGKEMEKSHD